MTKRECSSPLCDERFELTTVYDDPEFCSAGCQIDAREQNAPTLPMDRGTETTRETTPGEYQITSLPPVGRSNHDSTTSPVERVKNAYVSGDISDLELDDKLERAIEQEGK